MGYQRAFDDGKPTPSQPPCMHLRSKAIYVTGNPDPQNARRSGQYAVQLLV